MSVDLPAPPHALDDLEPNLARHTLTTHHEHHYHAAHVAKPRARVQGTRFEPAAARV